MPICYLTLFKLGITQSITEVQRLIVKNCVRIISHLTPADN